MYKFQQDYGKDDFHARVRRDEIIIGYSEKLIIIHIILPFSSHTLIRLPLYARFRPLHRSENSTVVSMSHQAMESSAQPVTCK